MHRLMWLVAACFIAASAGSAAAASSFDFYDRGPYRDGVPRPSQVLGYEPGTFHTNYANMERYVDALLRAASDRVAREPFGRTYEFRERALLVITSRENQARLAAIREATSMLADPRTIPDRATLDRLIADTPVTVWLNYSIHGDESASFEAMMQVAYQLAAGEDSLTRAIRDQCVVLLNLAHNPDGHERFVTWINAMGSGNADPLAIEQQYQQPWGIGGRTNHYQFDMNRDALAMSQLESRQMARAFRRWRPQVFVDHHGQTESFFFPPTAQPLNPVLPEREYERWNDIFGRANAAAFDHYGWIYNVRDIFDFFYPGYWDTWPTMQGAVGMTYETDGGGNLAIRRDDDTIVTLLDGIKRHFVASLATCETAARHRADRLRAFHDFAAGAIDEGRSGEVRAFALDPGADPLAAAALADNLLSLGIEVRWVGGAFRATAQPAWSDPAEPGLRNRDAGHDYVGTDAPPLAPFAVHEFRRGAYVIDLAQPAGRLARTVLERDTPMGDDFAENELEKYQRNIARGQNAPREYYDFYDVTAWSLPIAYGVEAFGLRQAPKGGVMLAPRVPGAKGPGTDVLPDSLAIGIPMTARESDGGPLELRDAKGDVAVDVVGGVEGGRARTAYVWSYDGDGAARVALRLLQEDFNVATCTRPMRAGGYAFPRGSFIARIERNPETIHRRIAELARESGVVVRAINTAYTEEGNTGIGSESTESLTKPRIAVVVDRPVSASSYGWLWFLLERKLGVRFTPIRARSIGYAELERFNVIIVPDGSAGALARTFGEGGIEAIKGWTSRGGALVCLDDAAEFPTLESVGLSSAKVVRVPRGAEAKPDSSDDEAAKRRPEYVPGAIYWASLDPRHFLAFGYRAHRIPVLVMGNLFLEPSKDGVNPVSFDERPLKLAGWSWPETDGVVEGSAYAVDEPVDRGHVIMIAGSPLFRMFWRGTDRMVLNAVLYAPVLD